MPPAWRRLALAALAVAVLALLILLLASLRDRPRPADLAAEAAGAPVAGPVDDPAPSRPPAGEEAQPPTTPPPVRTMADGRPFWRPGQPHWYGPKADPFIRQPHDYEPGTPEKLGNRLSEHLFDLEHVQDIVSRGGDPRSEIANVRGRPLDASELARARAVLQDFFDHAVPVVDAVLSDTMSRDAAYSDIGPRRWRMNEELRAALNLTEAQFGALWPHIPELGTRLETLGD